MAWVKTPAPAQIQVAVFLSHSGGRFYIANTAGQVGNALTTAVSPVVGGTTNIGGWFVGTSASPDPFFNAYWAAERLWRDVLGLVGSATANFTNVEARGFSNNIPGFLGNQPTSAADGTTKRVQLDQNAGFSPQARVMHELGHIASYLAHPWQITGDYTWGGNAGWGQAGAEWSNAGFEEAFATHYGSVAFWHDSATTPTTCLSSASCYNASGVPVRGTDLEATSYPFSTNNCSTTSTNPERRWPLSIMRTLWDIYDSHNDADGDSYGVNSAGHFWQHLAMPAFYPNGTGANQIDEPWNSSYTAVTEKDGRGAISYISNYNSTLGTSLDTLRVDNCSPP